MPATELIHPSLTVNETIQRHPASVAVFQRFGIDACCGGPATIEAAAARHGIDLQELLRSLHLAVDDQDSLNT